MKKTLSALLIFAIVMLALLGVSFLVRQYTADTEEEVQAEKVKVIANSMNEAGAVKISLSETTAHISGTGAYVTDGVVTIVYPGTYRVTGQLTDGQIVVNCEDYSGAVYIILDGADIACSTGPALHVVKADETVIFLAEGSENTLQDGVSYVIEEGQNQRNGAAVYSADELVIQGDGSLSVVGQSADGIRSKAGLTIEGGVLSVVAADDGLQGSDSVTVTDGTVTILSGGDGIHTTKGDVIVSGGCVTIASGGDGVDAAAQVSVLGGMLDITASSGPENYTEIELENISAKGLKGTDILICDGNVMIFSADDGLHGDSVTITGGTVTIATGDDAVHADGTITLAGGTVTVTESYEALEGNEAVLSGGIISLTAEKNGMDIGSGGLTVCGSIVELTASRPVKVSGNALLQSGMLYLTATGEKTPMEFMNVTLTGATLVVFSNVDSDTFLEGGVVPGSLLFTVATVAKSDTVLTLTDSAGRELFSLTPSTEWNTVLIASGALGLGQDYTLTDGEISLTGTLSEDCTSVTYEAAETASGEMNDGWDMGSSGEMNGGWNMGSNGEMNGGWNMGSSGEMNDDRSMGSGGEMNGGWDMGSSGEMSDGWNMSSLWDMIAGLYSSDSEEPSSIWDMIAGMDASGSEEMSSVWDMIAEMYTNDGENMDSSREAGYGDDDTSVSREASTGGETETGGSW